MTDRLREIEQRCEKATPGPWEHTYYEVRDEHDVNLDASKCAGKCPGKMGCECTYLLSNCILSSEDADFIAHAREDIPYLLGVIKEQAEEIERLQSLVGGPHLCEAARTVGCMCTGQCMTWGRDTTVQE